jgi:hypothetical protein
MWSAFDIPIELPHRIADVLRRLFGGEKRRGKRARAWEVRSLMVTAILSGEMYINNLRLQ